MKISIIIPTYNEEEYLPKLLESIKSQDFTAKEYGCVVVEGGLPGPGRNRGAEVAQGEILLFLDSDLELTENYLSNVIEEFESEDLGIAITQMTPLSEKKRDKYLHDLANWFMIAVENIKPHGAGCYGIISKKELHDEVNGFDENLSFGEDTDYIERVAEISEFKVLRNARIGVSTRRLEEEGLYTLLKQYGKSTVNDFRGKRTSAEDLGYEFGHDPIAALDSVDMERIAEKSRNRKIKDRINKFKDRDIEENKLIEVTEEETGLVVKEAAGSQGKKRIFYSVCGEGMGHAIRSSVILEHLTKKYDVYIFSLKANPTNLKEGYNVLYKECKRIKPNIIISDFENYSSMLSKIMNIPLISLDNIHMLTQCEYDYPPNHRADMLTAKAVTKSYILRPKRHIITSFFYPPLKHPKMTALYPPVLREEIMKLEPVEGEHVLVYQTAESSINLMEELKKLDYKFIVYGFNKDEVDENLTYRSFNEEQIFEDMRTAKAIIVNGGFTMISEAIYLKKPIYCTPAHKNFEQILNGFYVEKLGFGEYHDLGTILKS